MRILHSDDPALPDLAVDLAGDPAGATPVLLVHGMGGDHRTWRRAVAALRAARRPTIAVDLRGHGRSGRSAEYRLDDFADDLGRVVDGVCGGRVDVVGHSLGAHGAVRFAMRRPETVRRLVLEEVPPMPFDDGDVAERIAPSASLGERIRGVGALLADPRPALRMHRGLPDAVLAQFQTPDPQWWDRLAAVRSPTLVISGGRRSFLPPRHLRRVADAMPAGRFLTVEAGHSVHRDRGREFVAAMLAHLEQ
ncbi:alpha/beta fold hydrolase [Gordonia shandongensis]|uniref:alpha/beta fold hydrolase n=1 Tax=Gordonia shandongensis TaxID=376351 RepID=UPI000479184B|nr:alpha/beta fold hydrolase [Gordonia shandongensis]